MILYFVICINFKEENIMNLNKCERCGCFFVSLNSVCPNCQSKDENEISQLKSFLSENENKISIEDLSSSTGISVKNVNRFLQDKKIKSAFSGLGLLTNGNVSIGL